MKSCKNCGTTNPDSADCCKECGASLRHAAGNRAYYEDPNELIGGVEARYLRAFTERAADRYLWIWKNQAETGKKTSFNWVAFFFPFHWFLARRMIKAAVCLEVISVCITLILALASGFIVAGRLDAALAEQGIQPITYEESYGLLPERYIYQTPEMYQEDLEIFYQYNPGVKEKVAAYDAYQEVLEGFQGQIFRAALLVILLDLAFSLAISIAIGLFGDHLYFRYAKRKIQKALDQSGGADLLELRGMGGVEPSNIVIAVVLSAFLNVILSLL